MTALYVENDPFCAEWLRRSITAGLIAPGDVDDRDIRAVSHHDVSGYTQVHLFAGIGLWSFALRVAGWPDDREVWTGSCPCQPFSRMGTRLGFDDPRHLWPEFRRLVEERHPHPIFGEQVTGAPEWITMVRSELETLEYTVGILPIEAASTGARHLRDRYWFVAADRSGSRLPPYRQADVPGAERQEGWRAIADAAWRAAEPKVRVLAHGHPGRISLIRAIGNAIDPRPAAAFISSYMEVEYESHYS